MGDGIDVVTTALSGASGDLSTLGAFAVGLALIPFGIGFGYRLVTKYVKRSA